MGLQAPRMDEDVNGIIGSARRLRKENLLVMNSIFSEEMRVFTQIVETES
jgi:hypothetical protein